MRRCFIILTLLVVIFAPFAAFAQKYDPGCETDVKRSDEPIICLSVPFGNVVRVSGISEYIQKFYQFFVGAVLSLAVFMIVIGGVQWVFALGNSGKIARAKSTISNAFAAVILTFISVGLLRIINPDLISLKLPEIKTVEENLFFDVENCWQLPRGTVVKNEGSEYVLQGDPLIDKPKFRCGQSYPILGKISGGIRECKGTACIDAGGKEGLCKPSGHCLFGSYVYGTISWMGNYYVEDQMRLVAICEKDGQLTTEQTKAYNPDIGSRERFYAFEIKKDEMSQSLHYSEQCRSKTLKGYLLGVEVNDASSPLLPTVDDNRLLSKDCNKFIINVNKTDELADFMVDNTLIPSDTNVWTSHDLTSKPLECNIVINEETANVNAIRDIDLEGCQNCVTLASAGVPITHDIRQEGTVQKAKACDALSHTDCKIERVVATKLLELKAKKPGWHVTEAYPPVVAHTNPCHSQATCVDVNITDTSINTNINTNTDPKTITGIQQYIYNFVTAAEQVGLRAVYEVSTSAEKTKLTTNSTPNIDAYIQVVPSITAPHFSVYNNK